MSEFKSCAKWPDACCPSIGNYSDDTHGSFKAADAVIGRLLRDGFGGDLQFFPVETWVEEKVDGVWVRVTEERRREITTVKREAGFSRNLSAPFGKFGCAFIGTEGFPKAATNHLIQEAAAHTEGMMDTLKLVEAGSKQIGPDVVLIESDYSEFEKRAEAFAKSLKHEAGPPIIITAAQRKDPPVFLEATALRDAAVAVQKGANCIAFSGTEKGRFANELRLVDSDHPALHTVSLAVTTEELPYVRSLYSAAKKFMKRHKGCGLAANQLGITQRWFVWEYGMVINPNITHRGATTQTSVEGCLSFPGKRVSVKRHKTIDVEYIDERGAKVKRTLEGFTATCFQHEHDHLNGICILDGKSSADIIEADRRRNHSSVAVASIFGMAAALGVSLPQSREPAPREKTADDLDRLEAARLKRERKEQKRKN